jgi:hypothetical protein
MYYVKRYADTLPLKVGEPTNVYQDLDPGFDLKVLGSINLKQFQFIGPHGEFDAYEFPMGFKQFYRDKDDRGTLLDTTKFIGGQRVLFRDREFIAVFNLVITLSTGEMISSMEFQMGLGSETAPDYPEGLDHIRAILEFKRTYNE